MNQLQLFLPCAADVEQYLLARLSGSDFALLMHAVDRSEALEKAQSVRRALCRLLLCNFLICFFFQRVLPRFFFGLRQRLSLRGRRIGFAF